MDLGLSGKTVIVTGGGSNIGRGISLAFAAEGANIVIADVDDIQGEKVAKQAKAAGGNITVIKTDVTNWDSVQAMVMKVLEQFKTIDVLVNNVGWIKDGLFIEKPRGEWEKEITVNFWGTINCTRAVLGHMVERKSGKIISIASDSGRMGEHREAVYAGCKSAIIAMSKSIARETGRYGININVVCPGGTIPQNPDEEAGEGSMWGPHGTGRKLMESMKPEQLEQAKRMYPLRRFGTPEDVANMVLFLASNKSSFITGQTISVSGGYTMA